MMYARRSDQNARFTLPDSKTDNADGRPIALTYEFAPRGAMRPVAEKTRTNFLDLFHIFL
jgi:hypothetical protein